MSINYQISAEAIRAGNDLYVTLKTGHCRQMRISALSGLLHGASVEIYHLRKEVEALKQSAAAPVVTTEDLPAVYAICDLARNNGTDKAAAAAMLTALVSARRQGGNHAS